MSRPAIVVGCAGWSVGRDPESAFAREGTHLQRYAGRLNGVEINSSFYRPHQRKTYERWAESVPADFRFALKVPKRISHELRLVDVESELDVFLEQCTGLGERLGCLLVQLPPSLVYEEGLARAFFQAFRARFAGPLVLEPRHPSWVAAQPLLEEFHVAQAAVDPSRISSDSVPGGWLGFRYWRLHGSPRIYHSAYDPAFLERLAEQMRQVEGEVWCVFDNTASGAAVGNALALKGMLV